MKYVNKSVVVEAFQFGVDDYPEWFLYKNKERLLGFKPSIDSSMVILDYQSQFSFRVYKGDFIIKEDKGELHVCKENIFKKTYEKIEENGECLLVK